MSTTYNLVCLPEVLVSGDRFAVIRRGLAMTRCCPWIPFPIGSPMCPKSRRGSEVPRDDRSSPPVACSRRGCGLARAALMWERVWPACWPALGVLGVFLVLGLFDLLPDLPGLLHAAILLGLGAAFVITLAATFRRIIVPDRFAARRRIERASGLQHRPLQTLADRPSGPRLQAARLWQAHLRRTEAATRRLRIGLPSAGLAARDPWDCAPYWRCCC